MSGWSRVFSVRSTKEINARDTNETIGAENTRIASLLQTGHGHRSDAKPIGLLTSKAPCGGHLYW